MDPLRIDLSSRRNAARRKKAIVLDKFLIKGIVFPHCAKERMELIPESASTLQCRKMGIGVFVCTDPVVQESAENADLREQIRMSADHAGCLHGSHGEARHPTLCSASAHMILCLKEGDDILKKHRLQEPVVHHMPSRSTRVLLLHHTVIHDNGKGHYLSLCKEVIQKDPDLSLGNPTNFILPVPMLKIEYRDWLRRGPGNRRRIDKAPLPLTGHP